MIACTNCGSAQEPQAGFCDQCGKPMVREGDGFSGVVTPPVGPPTSRPSTAGELPPGAVFAKRFTIEDLLDNRLGHAIYRATEAVGSQTRPIELHLFSTDKLIAGYDASKLLDLAASNQALRHAGVAGVRDIGEDGSRVFVAMEPIEGQTLREWLRAHYTGGAMPSFASVAHITRGLCNALDAGHRRGLVHGDLRPDLVRLEGDPANPTVRLGLFGFAPGMLIAGASGGAQHYMVPELITNPASASPASDSYSLALLLYEMLTGVLPTGHWQPPSSVRGDVPQALDQVILDGLSLQVLRRPQTGEAFRDRFDAAADGATEKKDEQEKTEQRERTNYWSDPAPTSDPGSEETAAGDREIVKKGALFVFPKKDAEGNWYMPEMVDDKGKRTKWTWYGGYAGAFFGKK